MNQLTTRLLDRAKQMVYERDREGFTLRGFTLIELIVVIAVIAVLVLLAAPQLIGQTDKAKAAQIQNDIRSAETIVMEWLATEDDMVTDWDYDDEVPEDGALLDKHLQDNLGVGGPLENISDHIKDIINTQLKGEFYSNKDGEVYYHTNKSITISDVDDKDAPGALNIKEYENESQDIVFHGGHENMFDGDIDTHSRSDAVITWEGNLTHRELEITGNGKSAMVGSRDVYVYFRDDAGNNIAPVGQKSARITFKYSSKPTTHKVIVPEGATQLHVEHESPSAYRGYIHEIKVPDVLDRPQNISITSKSHLAAFDFEWSTSDRVFIYENGKFAKEVNGTSTELLPDMIRNEYVFEFLFVNEQGNGTKATYTVPQGNIAMASPDFSEDIINGNPETYVQNDGVIYLSSDFENREIIITGRGRNQSVGTRDVYVRFKDAEGDVIPPVGKTNPTLTFSNAGRDTIHKAIVPEGATELHIQHEQPSARGYIYNIEVPKLLKRPSSVGLTTKSDKSSFEFGWDTVERALLFENGEFAKDVVGTTTKWTPNTLNDNYNYDFLFMNQWGNGTKVTHTVSRGNIIMASSDFGNNVFDGSLETYAQNDGVIHLDADLAGREMEIIGKGRKQSVGSRDVYAYFRDDAGNNIAPVGTTNPRITFSNSSRETTQNVTVPEGATQLYFEHEQPSARGYIYSVRVLD